MYVHIYMYMYMFVFLFMYMDMQLYMCMYVYVFVWMCMDVYVRVCTCMYVYVFEPGAGTMTSVFPLRQGFAHSDEVLQVPRQACCLCRHIFPLSSSVEQSKDPVCGCLEASEDRKAEEFRVVVVSNFSYQPTIQLSPFFTRPSHQISSGVRVFCGYKSS